MASRSSRAPPSRRKPPAKRATPGKTTGCAPNRTIHPTRAARLTRMVQAQISTPATTALATSRRPAGTGDCPTPRLLPPSRRRWSPRSPPAGTRSSRSAPARVRATRSGWPAGRALAVAVVGRPVGSGVDGEEDEIEIRGVGLLQRLGWEPRRAFLRRSRRGRQVRVQGSVRGRFRSSGSSCS